MTAVLVGRYEHRSDEWHAARANRLGGSEIAAVLGLSEWESRFSLWHRKAGNVEPVEQTAPMEWGLRLEPTIAAKWLENHPDVVALPGGTFHAGDEPRFISNPDLLLAPGCSCPIDPEYGEVLVHDCTVPEPAAILEVKTASAFDAWKWADPDEDPEGIPVYYRAQGLWYGGVVHQLPTVHFAVLLGGSDYREYVLDVEDVADEVANLRAAAAEFLDSIAAGHPPALDGSTSTYQVMRELHPDIDDVDVELDNDLAIRFIHAVTDLKAAESEELLARSLVAEAMGTARRARWDGRSIATRQTRNGSDPFVVAGRNLTALITQETTAA